MKPAVFLDRDGTIIEDRGYLSGPDDVYLFEDTADALRRLQEHFLLFVITNQNGVAKGIITLDDVRRVNRHIDGLLHKASVRIEEWYVCPHARADGCKCIKPNSCFLEEAARTYGISLGDSYVIGDHPHDVETARNAGATGIFVCTGHGARHRNELPPDTPVFDTIGAAAASILRETNLNL